MKATCLLGNIWGWKRFIGNGSVQRMESARQRSRLFLTIAAVAGLATNAFAQINISYVGPDRTHLTYNGTAGGEQTEIKFQVVEPSGGTRLIAQASGSNASVSGSLCDSEASSSGDYRYEFRTRVYDTETKTWSAWGTAESRTAHVDNFSATGTLLFDESLANAQCDGVNVPAGLTLTLSGALSASTNGYAISVSGTLAFDTSDGEGVSLLPYPRAGGDLPFVVYLNSDNQTVPNVTGGCFYMEGENTTVSGCRNIEIYPSGGDLELSAVSNGVVHLSYLGDGRTLHASDSVLSSSSTYPWLGHGTLDLKRVSWSGALTVTASGVVQASECDFGYVETGSMGWSTLSSCSFHASDSRFGSLYVDRAAAGLVSLDTCLFSGSVTVFGGAPSFYGCEFGGVVDLKDRSATVIQGCRFLQELRFYNYNTDSFSHESWGTLYWYEANTPSPVISGNAFMGDRALHFKGVYDGLNEYDYSYPPSPIAIGANYYGTPGGTFDSNYESSRGYLPATYKAQALENYNSRGYAFSFAEPLITSPLSSIRKDTRVFPRFWVNGHIIGQNTIAHEGSTIGTSDHRILVKGRDTLLSVDLSCTEESLKGVRVYAVWNGNTVEANRLPSEVRRNPATFSPALIRGGRATFDFVLPGIQSGAVFLEVFLDASGVTGFDEDAYPAEDTPLFSGTVSFCDPPQRELNIWVLPVEVLGITGSWGTGNAGPTVKTLREDIPDLLSIPADLLNVQQCAPITVVSPTTFLTSVGMLNELSAELAAGRWLRSKVSGDMPDFIVAVMPNGLITCGADGASFAGRRRIAFVDELKPKAALHELGHGVGLCTDDEEYETYPPDGLPVERSTLFMTETAGTQGRVKHLPYEDNAWYNSGLIYYDTMGSTDPSAPLVGTVGAFHAWFQENLTAPVAAAAANIDTSLSVAELRLATAAALPGTKRILLSGATEYPHDLLPGTLSFMDVTALDVDECAPSDSPVYRLQAFDSDGLRIYYTLFAPGSDQGAEWFATFDIPEEAVTINVVDLVSGQVIKELSACGLQSVSLNVDAPDGEIGTTFSANWSVQSEQQPASGQLKHFLYYRAGAEDDWHLFAGPTCATNIAALSTFLPDAATLSLKLVSSDGLSSVETLAEGLSVPPRPPVVSIRSPLAGTIAQSNAVWKLEAGVVDFTPGNTGTGVWSSSLQGVLGPGPLLMTELIPGEHQLRYDTLASNGLTGSAEVAVSVVEEMTTSDIGFDDDALRLYNSHADPTGLSLLYVATGETNRFDLTLRNGGADTTARLQLYLTTPLTGETFASTVDVSAAPFEEYHIPLYFLAEGDGDYTVRAVLDQIVPSDTNPADNEGQWTFSTPVTITLSVNLSGCGTVLGDDLYLSGVPVTVSAAPISGYAFSSWTENGTAVSTNAEYTFEAATNRTLVANFVSTQAVISVSCMPYSGGTASGGGVYAVGGQATVTAVANVGYRFVNWTELNTETWAWFEVSTNTEYTFTVSEGRTFRLYANFEAIGTGGGDEEGVALEEALDAPSLTFSTDETAPWTGKVLTTAIVDGDAARSGAIEDDGATWMETTVSGPGSAWFWWRVSSESGYDIGQFLLDGTVESSISGETTWSLVSVDLGEGTHTLRWTYTKNGSVSEGDDCVWVDGVEISTGGGGSDTISLEEALDAPSLTFDTDETAPWTGTVLEDAIEDGDAACSGIIEDGETTWMELTVSGPGTLSFWWKASTETGYDFGQFYVGGNLQTNIDGQTEWVFVSVNLDEGSQSLRWVYAKDDSVSDGNDCVWVDNVVFTSQGGSSTTTTPVPIPHSWLDGYPALLIAAGGNYETAAGGDYDSDGQSTWQEYVAGTDPTNRLSVFRGVITMEMGSPHITWTPNLGSARQYTVEGKEKLSDSSWGSTNAESRFFRVRVQIP